MTKEELAAELYELIVIMGRWKGEVLRASFFDNSSYYTLPEWLQEIWLLKADEFAVQNGFELEDS